MPFGRRPSAGFAGRSTERLVGRARVRLAVFTLVLVTALVAVVGLATAAVAVQALDASVDRSLRQSAADAMVSLTSDSEDPGGVQPGETDELGASQDPGESDEPGTAPGSAATPGAGETEDAGTTAEPDTSAEPGDGNDDGAASGANRGTEGSAGTAAVPSRPTISPPARPLPGANPQSSASPSPSPQPSPSAGVAGAVEPDDHVPAGADTYFLVLDTSGAVVSNPRRVALGGLPDTAAVAAARSSGEDLRSGTAAGAPVRLLTQPIVDAAGKTTGFLQTVFVLSLHRSQEDQLWQTVLLVSLIGLFGAAAVTLLVTHRALSPIRTAFATERRFVASASHELRTPVAVIRASAEILDREDLVLPEGRHFVADVISESDRLARLVGDLLALSSVQAGAISIHPRRLDLLPFVHELAGRAKSMAGARDVQIVVEDGGTQHPWVDVDPERLEQLLMIFIDNAVDHSPPGTAVRLVLNVSRASGRQEVSLSVVDQGPGVPEAERTRVFEPFARLSGWRRTSGGTGLGLAVARALAERLGASIQVGDAPGGGAVFSVTLRLEQVRPARP